MSSSESEYSDSDASDSELQEAFAKGLIKPGLNEVIENTQRTYANNVKEMKQKLISFKLNLPWIETLDLVNKQAPLAPELALQIRNQEEHRANLMRNNKKLPQRPLSEDPVLNDFKREMMFYRQAQEAVTEGIPRIKNMGILTKRPDDYYAEMAKSDEHMQKVREQLMKKQAEAQRSERVKQIRAQRKENKAKQIQARLERQQEKKEMLDKIKKVRKGVSKNLDFIDNKGGKKKNSKSQEKRAQRDAKFGFGGKKRGLKKNTSQSCADIEGFGKKSKGRNPSFKKGNKKMQFKARKGKPKNKKS